ncbi:MAG: UDP-2,3-diacylglucosamine diphosphatase [Pseudomonadota bacterium]|nr:UDP-2,3-diacylglucosamine diphosphatase [Pseudomonadota bacterium]
MNSYSLFIADIHLQPDDQHPINQSFYDFLDHEAPKAEALYILGDLFEMWVGDDIGLELYQTAVNKFKSLTQSGLPIYLLFGNRDFLMRKTFWQASGIHSITEPAALTLYGQQLLVLHGDSLCTDDHDYQRARKVLRNPIVTWLFLRLPKSKRLNIGNKMREKSKKYNQNKAENIMDVNELAVVNLLEKHPQVEHLIHGHTHRPGHHRLEINGNQKHRWVLGDWRPETQIIKVSAEGLALVNYPDNT